MAEKRFKLDRVVCAHHIERVCCIDSDVALDMIDALCDFIYEAVCAGFDVHFRQLGTFRLQRHKGHAVQFGATERMEPYPVLKFKPMTSVGRALRARDAAEGVMWNVPEGLEAPFDVQGRASDARIDEVLDVYDKRVDVLYENMRAHGYKVERCSIGVPAGA